MDKSTSSSSGSDARMRYLETARERVTSMTPAAKADLNYRYNRAGQESVRQNPGRAGF